MKPNHHLDASTIVSYAAGTLDEAFTVVAAAHLAMCPECRQAVRQAEAFGGDILESLSASSVTVDCRDRTMAALDRATLHRLPLAAPRSELPLPLARLINVASFDEVKWKKKAPGVAMFDVPLPSSGRGRLKLLKIGGGRAMPEHGHGGSEMTLILKGAYRDHMGRFGRGDVADLDDDIEHTPVAEAGEDCVCLVALERPTRFKSIAARILQPFVGI